MSQRENISLPDTKVEADAPANHAHTAKKNQWVFVFPGQGSQYIGMGKDFYQADTTFKDLIDEASDIANKNLSKLCFVGPISKLSNTDNLQVATTAINLAIFNYVGRNTSLQPSVVLGHSVGEYAALSVAGVLSFEDVIKATAERGRLMQREAKAHKSGMLAVKGVEPEKLSAILKENFDSDTVVIANDNALTQQVLSAAKSDLSRLATLLSEKRIEYVKLPVSGAWHSPLMKGCVAEYTAYLADLNFQPPEIPVVTNLRATFNEDPKQIEADLVKHLTHGVRWRESIENLLSAGYCNFIEVGPKKVLSRLIETINNKAYDLKIKNVESLANLESVQ